ncbi:isochorismatase family protein [Glycomyces sp. NPDC047010]|uniref:isochorismatase family protein n=1 Tax=Glycomyces sp. NPDC047010 TaxID=3155023 RepID=UPI0033CBA177
MTTLEPQGSAVVLVDLMPRLVALDLAPHTGGEVLAAALELARNARAAGVPVVAIRVERPGVSEQPPGSGLVEEVEQAADAVVVKRTIGGFQDTGLDGVLRGYGASTLVMAGIATNLGVESTARAASDLGYDLVFAEDAMTGLTGAEHEASVALSLPRFGPVAPVREISWSAGS